MLAKMLANRTLGLVLVIIGVLANNYVYLHDIILDKHAGAINLGWPSWVGIGVTLLVVAFGIFIVVRSQVPAAASEKTQTNDSPDLTPGV